MTNEPTAEIPAPRATGHAPGTERPAGRVATGTPAPSHGGGRTTVGPAGSGSSGSRESVTGEWATGESVAEPGTAVPGTDRGPGSDGASAVPAGAATTPTGRRRRRWLVPVLAVLLVASLGVAGYLYATTTAYAERLAWTEEQARAIGADLTLTRGELEGARAEIEGLQAQLTTAQERITALADEKAQIGDDREAQAQLLDYQARVSEAAGIVASALDRCVRGQDQLITYLEDAESYDPNQLTQFGSDVEALCQSASDANEALQSELADR